MKPRWWCVALAMLAASCLAQAQHGGDDFHGSQSAIARTRSEFGRECGIGDTSDEVAAEFVRSPEGEWSAGGGAGGGLVETARLCHEKNWMVAMHGELGAGMPSMHSGQMCFDAQGRVTRILDRYMDVLRCGCQRLTTFAFAGDGKLTGWEQTFVDLRTGAAIKPPPDAEDYPRVWEFHS